MNHLFWEKKNVKKILNLQFLAIIIIGITILIVSQVMSIQPDNVQQSISEKFNQIKNQIEFKGFDEKALQTLNEDYSKLFDGYSNIIITDNNGKILYNINDGYLSEKNKFSVLVDPLAANGYGSNIAYLIDSKNNVKYSAQLDIFLNASNLKEISSRNPFSSMLFPNTQNTFDPNADKIIKNNDGTSFIISPEANIIMNYDYIASKGLNLYSLYDSEHQYNNYFFYANAISQLRYWLLIAGALLLLSFCAMLPLWIVKSKHRKCSNCNKKCESDWILCPYCGTKLSDGPKREIKKAGLE